MACVKLMSAEAYDKENQNEVRELLRSSEEVLKTECETCGKKEKLKGAVTAGNIQNNTSNGNSIGYYTSYDWKGNIEKLYAQNIANSRSGNFVHAAQLPNDPDEGAVVYKDATASCGWLVAWSAPSPNVDKGGYRVYVDCGPIQKYYNIDWNDIKEKLNKSSNTSFHPDQDTGSYAFAKINATKEKKAALVAIFTN